MSYRLQKAAVLGSGVMGSGIACHLANIGMDVLLLDIVPFDLNEKDQANPVKRNSIVNGALKAALKSKPAALYHKEFAKRITTGNFTDDFEKIAEADWVIEVVVERLDIKQQIFEKVEKFRKAGSLITSNTSSIPIHLLVQGRSDDFKSHFCGTHFFNPARYMPLLEIIPHATTSPAVTDFFMKFGEVQLGKQTVLCKDTPAFIANRIGIMSGNKMMQLTTKYDMRVEEVDAIAGKLIARPNTAHFRLQDLVGIDTGEKVTKFVDSAVKGDEYVEATRSLETPKFMQFLLENKFFGNKSGQGFYQKTKKRDANGRSIVNALNLKTLEYEPAQRPKPAIVERVKAAKGFAAKMQTIVSGDDRESKFLAEYFAALFAYAANRVPEISDEFYPVDDAMRAGYMWSYGPFEYWDALGFEKGIELIQAQGEKVADWISAMQAKGISSFYKLEDGKKKYYDLASGTYKTVPGTEQFIILDALRSQKPVYSNAECTVHDIGDKVLCVEFTSKSNAIGDGIGEGIRHAIDLAEQGDWEGIVIGNNGKNFSVGANLMNIVGAVQAKDLEVLDRMVDDFQQLNMRIRTSKIPVVAATQGYVFGGGCEIAMHCDATVNAAESYIGLVEVGVGLLPGGGGTKELAVRTSDSFKIGDVKMPTLIEHFKSIATAAVSTSAYEAFDLGYLSACRDSVCVNTPMNIGEAKSKVLQLAKNYIAPSPRTDIEVLGRAGLAALYTAINEFYLGKYMSDYDVEVAKKVAYVICGGDLTQSQKVSEQYLLDLERAAFLSLLGNKKTHERIEHMLKKGKPLRN